jgi:hypothetical protein
MRFGTSRKLTASLAPMTPLSNLNGPSSIVDEPVARTIDWL